MIAALFLVFVFAALMFLVLAFDNHRAMMGRTMTGYARERLLRRRDRCLSVALAMFAVALVLVIAAAIL